MEFFFIYPFAIWISATAKIVTAATFIFAGGYVVWSIKHALTNDIEERKGVEQELRHKSETPDSVTGAFHTFLRSGDWSAASMRLLSFAVKHTESQMGFLGVVTDGPALRVLAHDDVMWNQTPNREMCMNPKCGNLRKQVFSKFGTSEAF